MKVTRLPVDTGPAAWNRILPPQEPAKVLEENITADWLVIGGGFAGLAAARRLSQLHPGDRIVLLEAKRIAEGPAGRNTGFMIDLPHHLTSEGYGGQMEKDRAEAAANRAGIAFAAEMAAEFGLSREAFNPSGKINAAATERGHKHNLDYAQHLSNLNEAHQLLDAKQMHEMTGTTYYQSGLFTPGAVMIQPALFVRGIARSLKANHISIFENCPVTQLTRNGEWTARTPGGHVSAPKVILGVNGHANSFGKFKGRLMHIHLYGSMTRALTPEECRKLGGADRWGVTPADPMGSTVRRISGTGGDRIIVRNRFTYDPTMQVSEGRVARMAQDHSKGFAARFPMLDGVRMEYRWGGRLCLSRNNVPALGEVDEGLYSACCQNGLGTAKGTLHGMLMADLASGNGSDLLDQVMDQPRPSRLPPNPFAYIGANAALRWSEIKAGKEI
ncbi:Gamma-glutamylputrescine oxidoreductase [Roseovarius litorisediminis]|uniref:Gamma-glutamylputrescine oxidoreductase n=1 Tax=Roseovarius litorisediminis TaxID=1312363 RepID=A0A1Y5RRH0_9RHOB|nr:FAD-binding oxidoreductase [Roseovarius litorisediminis]SLN23718.1 Gamma-glutamylputrescine oxidoreductase [Roseovarius litorisediminis]